MIRQLGNFHENLDLINRAATPSGKLLVWVVATALLLYQDASVLMPVALAAVLLVPQKRRLVLTVAAAGAILEPLLEDYGTGLFALGLFAGVALMLVSAIAILAHVHKLPAPIRNHPVLAVHTAIWISLILAALVPVFGYISNGIAPFLWRLSYLAQYMSVASNADRKLSDHLFYLMPVFGGTSTPYGKGLAYLSKHEAQNPTMAARSQLAGLKLLILAIAWSWLARLMDAVVYGSGELGVLGIAATGADLPRVAEFLQASAQTNRLIAWSSIYLELIMQTLALAASGHLIVGCIRLLGFNVFRNTYKPLLAESILEFWNRYYYYFKELLVEFFFYPTFLRTKWASARLRLFLAVFAAAGLGNMYYHIMTESSLIIAGDIELLWSTWNSRLIYCTLLATGIWLSMLRRQFRSSTTGKPSRLIRARKIAGVWTFFGLINIFNLGNPETGIKERWDALLFLIGL